MSKKILIVDDSKTLRQQLAFTLNKSGFTVVEAEDGLLGLQALENEKDIALLISDVNMPNMNGLDMVESIKKEGKHSSMPIIMLTTEGSGELISRAKAAGVKGWLVKPFEPEQLVGAVKKLLD